MADRSSTARRVLPATAEAAPAAALVNPRRSWRPLVRPLPYVAVLMGAAALLRGNDVERRAPNRTAALVATLARRGLFTSDEDVTWTRGASGVAGAARFRGRAIVRAQRKDEPHDIYAVETRLSPEGELLDVGELYNLTRTTGVDEGKPLFAGAFLATVTTVDGLATGIHVLDLDGRDPEAHADFTKVQRTQLAIANWQQTGQARGVVHDAYALDPVAKNVEVTFSGENHLLVKADGRAVEIDPATRQVVTGEGWVRPILEARARPGNVITWAVDRARALPWIGEERMQWVKAIAFTGLDYVHRWTSSMKADTTANDVAADLEGLGGTPTPSFAVHETGFPPPPMQAVLKPALPGEGAWIELDHDPFITPAPGTPVAFATSYLRTDKERPSTRVYVTLWDPRLVALHMVAGKVEPVSATGEAGTGVVPRAPEVMKNLVAGFNGGFQAKHGEFGMQADGILYLPPKPYAATILELADGSTAFGSWPNSENVPDDVISYRQNMTALLEGGKFNPWRRTWWGGTPDGWEDKIHTTRSALCLTKENFLGYFWGNELSPDALAQAMLSARCSYGVHLDMNPGLAGFEFYNVRTDDALPSLGRALQKDWEEEGSLKDMPELRYRARRMVRGMSHQNFPQYIHRHERDFFYLTRRSVVPGRPLPENVVGPSGAVGAAAKGANAATADVWRMSGLPQHGFPYAMAVATTPLDAAGKAKLHWVRLDPRAVRPAGSAGTDEGTPTVAAFAGAAATRPGERALWFDRGTFLIAGAAPSEGATMLLGEGPAAAPVRAAVGVHDEDGHLDWVEAAEGVPAEQIPKLLEEALHKAGSSRALLLRGDARIALGGALDAAGQPAPPLASTAARLVRAPMPGARPYFEDTPIVAPAVWQTLQAKRVRYFKKPTPPAAPPTGSAGAAPAEPAPAASTKPAPSNRAAPPAEGARPRTEGPGGKAPRTPPRGGTVSSP